MSKQIRGWVALTITISGPELIWRVGKRENTMPEIYETENEVHQAIIEDVEEDIRQFHDGERDYDEINWPEDNYIVAEIEIDEDGKLIVFQTGISGDIRHSIIETTLQEWRDNL